MVVRAVAVVVLFFGLLAVFAAIASIAMVDSWMVILIGSAGVIVSGLAAWP